MPRSERPEPQTVSLGPLTCPKAKGVRVLLMTSLITPPSRIGKIPGLCLCLLRATGLSVPAAAAPPMNPQDSVRSLYDTLLTTMQDGRTLGQSGRYARLAPVVSRLFDVPLMARLAVGTSWVTLSPAQQQQVTAAFEHYISATYADRFDSYSGEQLQVIGEQPYGAEITVKPRSSNLMVRLSVSIIACVRKRACGKSQMCTWTDQSASWLRSTRNSTRSFSTKASTV